MYARIIDTVTGNIVKVGRIRTALIIKKAEKKAVRAMRHYEGEVVLYGSINEKGPDGREIHLTTPSVHSKKYIISAYKAIKHTKPLYALRKFKR